MKRMMFAVAAVVAMSVAPASAQVIDLSLITCKQLLEADQARQNLISAWMAGYFSSAKNITVMDPRYTERNGKASGAYCRKNKSDTVMNAMVKNYR